MRHKLLALVTIAAMAPLAAQAQPLVQSQEGIALQNEILQLQSQVQQLQSGGGSANGSALGGGAEPAPATAPAPSSDIVTSLLNQVNQLQSQVQQLSGQVDTLQNQVNTQHDATEKEIGDLNFKLGNGAAPGAAPQAPQGLTSTTPEPAPETAPQAPPQLVPASPQASASPSDTLHAGMQAYDNGDYASAEAAARAVLHTSGSSPQAYRAQYLLAQALAGENKPQDAAIAYDNAYNRNRTGPEAPQSLLGLASSLAAINQNEAACDTLSSLRSQFPSQPAGMTSRMEDVSHRAHCS